MAKTASNQAQDGTPALQTYSDRAAAAGHDISQIAELAAAAIGRLQRDIETFHPNKPFLAYALAGETHKAIMHQWRQYSPDAQIALLKALLDEATGLLHQLQSRSARLVPLNGYMFGLQDEVVKLEALADIALEEIHRIEGELHTLEAGDRLQ